MPTPCISTDGTTVDEQVARLLAGRTVAVAESCTGGLMSARLTDRAGSSEYFAGGIVAYSNEAKADLWVSIRVDRTLRGGLDRGCRGARRPARPSGSTPTSAWASRASRVQAAAPRRNPSAWSASRSADRDGGSDHPQHAASWRPRRHPRPLHDSHRCTCCAGCCWGSRNGDGTSGRSVRRATARPRRRARAPGPGGS